jgi:multiple sugar transport system substrate-binding protein
VEAYSWDGVLLGMPVMGSNVYLIGYNKDVFDEAGVEYPKRYWTWYECLETAKKVTLDRDGDGDPEVWGLTFNVINPSRLLPYLWSWGADFYNYPELSKCTLNSPEAVAALEFALSWIREHNVSPPPEMGASELGISFDAGLVAMADVGSGSWVDPKDPSQFRWGFNWGLTDFPKDVATRTLIHSNGMSIARTSKQRDEAWELLQFLMSEESQILYSKRVGKVSAIKSVGATYAFENLPAEDLQVVNDAIEYAWGRVHWRTPVWHKSASGTQVPEMEAAWLGERSVKEAMNRTCEQVDALFAELD